MAEALSTIIIPTFNRPNSLRRCLDSLDNQTDKRFKIKISEEPGRLSEIRNKAARHCDTPLISFIDDDVFCTPDWFRGVASGFTNPNIAGVSGRAVITEAFRGNRDIFKYRAVKRAYDAVFLRGKAGLPGHITEAGAWTTGACNADCDYVGRVDFLEACNMTFRRDIFEKAGGFDEGYVGVGDWSEPDLCFRIRRLGYSLHFSGDATLYHEPSCDGAFKKRKADAQNRLGNYLRFAGRWVKPHWRHTLYKLFLRGYYSWQSVR